MAQIASRCVFRCDLCSAYNKNIKSSEDKTKVSEGWAKYWGQYASREYRLHGCLASDNPNSALPDKSCLIRPCVMKKGLNNCAQCNEYVCKKSKSRMASYQEIADKHKGKISKEEYDFFFEPYDSRKVLDEIRKTSQN